MLIHDWLHRIPRGLVACTACGEGWGILAHGRRGLVMRGRIVSARVLLVYAVGCRVWSVVRSATWDVLYRVSSCVFQSDTLVIVVVCRIMGWRRNGWRYRLV